MFPESPYLWLPSIPCPWPAKSAEILTAVLLLQSQVWRVQRGTLNSAVYYNPTMCLIMKVNRPRNISRC